MAKAIPPTPEEAELGALVQVLNRDGCFPEREPGGFSLTRRGTTWTVRTVAGSPVTFELSRNGEYVGIFGRATTATKILAG
jgi:hypothetical protein